MNTVSFSLASYGLEYGSFILDDGTRARVAMRSRKKPGIPGEGKGLKVNPYGLRTRYLQYTDHSTIGRRLLQGLTPVKLNSNTATGR